MRTHHMRPMAALTALLLPLLSLSLLALNVVGVGKDAAMYLDCFERYANTSASGVEKGAYPALAAGLADYFAFETDTPQVVVQKGGELSEAYSEKELVHLSDVRALFAGLNAVGMIALIICALLILLMAVYVRKYGWTAAAHGYLYGLLVAVILLGVLVIWALTNFDGLFITLHKVLFTNDLWLLNPQTDVLIQLMPTPMFTHLAGVVALRALVMPILFALGACVCAVRRLRRSPKGRSV